MDQAEHSNFYILTGGPGAGKTVLIEALRLRGYACVDEVARKIIQEQHLIGGDALHDGDQRKFADLMLTRSIAAYEQVTERVAPVFFDRGLPELVGYGPFVGHATPGYFHKAAALFRFNKRVFILPPWPEIYGQDDERKHDFAEAVESWRLSAETYPKLGYELVEVPKLSIADRVDFVLSHIKI
ncbi:MAG: AAA family ATPase [Parvibaculaceae bacterium]